MRHAAMGMYLWLVVVSGVRRGELCGLQVRDIHLDSGEISSTRLTFFGSHRLGPSKLVMPSSSLLDCLGRGRRVRAREATAQRLGLDATAPAPGMAAIEKDGGGAGYGDKRRPSHGSPCH